MKQGCRLAMALPVGVFQREHGFAFSFPFKGFAASPTVPCLFFVPCLGPVYEILALVSQTLTYTHKKMIWHWIWKFREEAGFGG